MNAEKDSNNELLRKQEVQEGVRFFWGRGNNIQAEEFVDIFTTSVGYSILLRNI